MQPDLGAHAASVHSGAAAEEPQLQCLIRSIPTEVTRMGQPFGVPRRESGTATAQNTRPIAAAPADMEHPRVWKGPSAVSPGHKQDGDVSPIQNHPTLLGLWLPGGAAAPWPLPKA